MPGIPPKPRSSACCRRGYWNAIAFGAAALWASTVALNTLTLPLRFSDYESLARVWKIIDILEYPCSPVWLFEDTRGQLTRHFRQLAVDFKLSPLSTISLLYTIVFFFPYTLQWIVFLGVLRLYWWRRRAPVTGWSALAAVSVMAATILTCHILYHYGVRL